MRVEAANLAGEGEPDVHVLLPIYGDALRKLALRGIERGQRMNPGRRSLDDELVAAAFQHHGRADCVDHAEVDVELRAGRNGREVSE